MCPLHVACESSRLEMVKYLVEESDVNLNTICRLTGYSPLMYAAQVGDRQIVEYLIFHKGKVPIDVNIVSCFGRTVKDILMKGGYAGLAELITAK
jgi:ankyrin repeat protein